MTIEEQLSFLWFSQNEIKVYISLLRSSWNYVSQLSKDTKIERVSLYYTLELLKEKWLIQFVIKNKIKFFIPEKPEKIVNAHKEKLNIAENLLPWLKMLENTTLNKPSFKYFEWMDWVKEVLKEIFEYKDIKSYANLYNAMNHSKELLDPYFKKIIKDRIKFNIILPYNQSVIDYLIAIKSETQNKTINYVFINQVEFPFEYDVFITDKIVWIISIINGEIIAIRIESMAYANSQRAIFNLAWLGATNFVV
ncbi:MAG: hypothetical protein ACD_2C00091G0007 [uncultured bacterium (gcode 4)]|uniref:Transcription regulator TrmB N-terminal domain-containing protein n=1 Tax=uncultured bacterium (gcode 4) TaxID=1234023 RepID=K2FF28_9BACT|nr:MAG: hypothetical protein ACD_2C00091G0007 [uncultured bacterium (gcode 4)]